MRNLWSKFKVIPPLLHDTSSSFSFPRSTSFSHSLRFCLCFATFFSSNCLLFSLTSFSSFIASCCCMPDTRSKMSVCRWMGGVIIKEKKKRKNT